MIYSPQLLDCLQSVQPQPWEGQAFRHMFADYPPDQENTRGARWNPPDVAAIYTSLTREGAIAEADHQLAIQPIRPKVRRTIYRVQLNLKSVLDLTNKVLFNLLELESGNLGDNDLRACQQVGGAAAWLEHDGILVPSARSEANNLVIFPANRDPNAKFDVCSQESFPSGD